MTNPLILGGDEISSFAESASSEALNVWSGVTAAIKESSDRLAQGLGNTVAQYEALGRSMADRAAEHSRIVMTFAEGVGSPAERQMWQQVAGDIVRGVDSMRAEGASAYARAGEAATKAAAEATRSLVGAVAGKVIDAAQVGTAAMQGSQDGNWRPLGEAIGQVIGTAVGAAAAAPAMAGLAAFMGLVGGAGAAVVFAGVAAAGYFGAKWGGLLLGDDIAGIAELVGEQFGFALSFTPRIDPLVLDLDGDGLELTAATGQVLFDHNADGIRTGTGWVASDDALLVWDRNGNGLIDSGRELFGVDMIKANGQFALDGFDALRDLDANGDGAFTSADAAYSQVRMWRDLDQDGVTDAGELASLAASNIARISLVSTPSGALINNNRIDSTSTVTRTNGSTTTAGAVDFAVNGFAREFTPGTVTGAVIITAQAQALPEMRGSGMVRDLREAMSLGTPASQALVSLVQQFAGATTRDAVNDESWRRVA